MFKIVTTELRKAQIDKSGVRSQSVGYISEAIG